MHIGRSRNDMGVTMYRMSLRRYVLRLIEHHLLLQESVLQLAADHKETIMPAYTHTQPAQPTTFGHYTLAIYDTMQRDLERMKKTYQLLNQSPMGRLHSLQQVSRLNENELLIYLDLQM